MLKLLLVVAIFALVTYLVTRALQERGGPGGQPVLPRPKLPRKPSRPVAPDDDEDFLRELERRRRRAKKPPEDG
ncbi:hypothetical protein [Nocardioides sp. TF02-7]|uniref:hypothetical protein n=1 Tax=Nocardioides sp. TF02-7 TaxID=2917724 RepID=UPI001F05F3F4|nr:hypothetical protein [Nocardioides sp. TF02-7]UMG93842.1 hypothetical protein MF408_06835 [Nocardioides sp. TF02-7]